MPVSVAGRVTAQTTLEPPYFLTEIAAPEVASAASPGQFVMARVPGVGDPLLARPFSIFGVGRDPAGRPEGVSILYNVVGRGTALLAGLRPGDPVHLVGPLGHGFALDRLPARPLLVAGGIGIAAFLLLAEEIVRRGHRAHLLFGARSGRDLVALDRLEAAGVEVGIATDDGSRGRKGFVTDLLAEELASADAGETTAVYACGPTPMLRRVQQMAAAAGVRSELALEARMACGFGVCLGCVVPSATQPGAYRLVCKDGPCLDGGEVLL